MLTLRLYLRTPTTPDTMPAQPAAARHLRPPTRSARLSRRYPQAASLPLSKARPTTCVAIAGSARPLAQTEFTIAWYLVPEVEQEITELTEIKFCWLLLNLSCSCMHCLRELQ